MKTIKKTKEQQELAELLTPEESVGLSKKEFEHFQMVAKTVAMSVRNNMEDFHCRNLTDTQMRELNPLVRDAIFTTLIRLYKVQTNRSSKSDEDSLNFNSKLIPNYWEDCKFIETL